LAGLELEDITRHTIPRILPATRRFTVAGRLRANVWGTAGRLDQEKAVLTAKDAKNAKKLLMYVR